MFGFGKKKNKNKKRVIVGASAIFEYLQQSIDLNITEYADYLIVLFNNKQYTLGLYCDAKFAIFKKGKKQEDGRSMFFYVDDQEFDTFEHFKAGANFDGQLLAEIQGGIEVLEACGGPPHYVTIFENYIVEETDS